MDAKTQEFYSDKLDIQHTDRKDTSTPPGIVGIEDVDVAAGLTTGRDVLIDPAKAILLR